MSTNTALVTDAATAAAQATLDDYSVGVSAHLGGDWGQHNQLLVYASRFRQPVSGHDISAESLRLSASNGTTVNVVRIPIFSTAQNGVVGSAPIITGQPVSITVEEHDGASFSVTASSPFQPLTYRWYKNGVSILGATHAVYSIPRKGGFNPGVHPNDQGIYTVVVTNPYGSVTSAPATLTVSPLFI